MAVAPAQSLQTPNDGRLMDARWRLSWSESAQVAMRGIGREEWVGAIEPWVTEAMAGAPRRMRRWLVRFFAKRAGLSPRGLSLVSGHLRLWRRFRELRCPDLLLVDTSGAIRVVIEMKASAELNGRWGYCPWARSGYSNQAICYAHGCWTDLDLKDAKFLLVVPKHRLAHLQAWRSWAVAHYHGAVDADPWTIVDLDSLYQELTAVARDASSQLSHAAVLVRLIAAWWWRIIPDGVPLIIV